MRKLTILCDMDGIVADLHEPWLSRYNKDHNDSITKSDIKEYSVDKSVRIGTKIFDYLYEPGFFADLPPIPGALEALEEMVNMGHLVVISSAPSYPGTSVIDKPNWIRRHAPFIHKRHLMLGHLKHLLKGDVFIDDSPDNIELHRVEWPDANIMTIAYPYNQSVKHLTNVFAEDYRDTKKAWRTILEAVKQIP